MRIEAGVPRETIRISHRSYFDFLKLLVATVNALEFEKRAIEDDSRAFRAVSELDGR